MATIADLTGETIDSSYGTLLMVTNTAGITSSLQTVQSGLGVGDNVSALQLSSTVVSVDGSLGVGTDSITAGYALDIEGQTYSRGSGASAAAHINLALLNNADDNSFYINNIGGAGTSKLSLNDQVYIEESTGNVGIGHSPSATARLDVTTSDPDVAFFRSSNATKTNFYINNTNETTGNTANLYLCPANNTAGAQISAIAMEDFGAVLEQTADLAFYTRLNGSDLTERMRIDASGNVGISCDPIYALDAIGSTNYRTLRIGQIEATGAKRQAIAGRHYTDTEEDVNLIGMFADATDTTVSIGGGFGVTGDFNSATQLEFHTASDNTTTATTASMTIDSSGNVGIGCDPATLLELSDASSPTIRLSDERNIVVDGDVLGVVEVYSDDDSTSATGVTGQIKMVADGNHTASQAGTAWTFHTNTGAAGTLAERMRIDSTGQATFNSGTTDNVAVFTSSDSGAGIKLTDDTGSSTLQTTGVDLRIGVDEEDEVDDSTMSLRVDNSTKMRIDSSGNVGIGTDAAADPAYPLHVESSTDGDWMCKIRNTHATNGYGLLVAAGDDSAVQSFRVANQDDSKTALTVKGDGNVFLPNLPDADPGVAGALYHSSGTVMISL